MIAQLFWASFGAIIAFVVGMLMLFPADINDVFDEEDE
jgi:hypothetical protein